MIGPNDLFEYAEQLEKRSSDFDATRVAQLLRTAAKNWADAERRLALILSEYHES
jgi:hypothetical protein